MVQPKLSRRAFLGTILGGSVVLATSGCSNVIDRMTRPELPDTLNPPSGLNRNPIAHLLNRAAFGPRPGQIEAVTRMGRERWLDRQLNWRDLKDDKLDWRLRRYDTIKFKPRDLLAFDRGQDREFVAGELGRTTLLRAIHSERQLYEVMVGFWSDHFSIYQFKNAEVTLLKPVDDREVIRKHALGKFKDLLTASAHSPAMLYYLDNAINEKTHPNENYAREIMELHTLGVDGGYTETDVLEVARCFTGWTVNQRGEFVFRDEWHDTGEKQVLGHTIPAGGGKDDADRVLRIVLDHPSTAQYICTKLARRFVADDPPPAIISACVETWRGNDGDIRKVLKTLLTHPEFDVAPPKLKRPFEFVVSLLRAVNADYNGHIALLEHLENMGHRPFSWVTPDGYPDVASGWTNAVLKYWNFAMDALQGKIKGVKIDVWDIADHVNVEQSADEMLKFFGRLSLSRDLTDSEAQILQGFMYNHRSRLDLRESDNQKQMLLTLGLMLSAPAFLMR
jgi:hypothetical protein